MGERMAKFLDPEDEYSKLLDRGGVAVMDRQASRIGFDKKFAPQYIKPQVGGARKQLSYCMAILKPDNTEAERYLHELKQDPGKNVDKLSDQWFLNEFLPGLA